MRHSYWVDWVFAAVSAVALLNLYVFITHAWWGGSLSAGIVNAGWIASVGTCVYAYVLKPRWACRVQLLAIFLGIAWGVCYQGIAEGSYLSHFSNVLRYGVVFGVLSVPLTPTITLSVMAARRAAPA